MKSSLKMSLAVLAAGMLVGSCANKSEEEPALTKSGLNPANFVSVIDGKPTKLYTLTNANGVEACITNFGGRIVSLMVPDRNGNFVDVVLGYDSVADYADRINKPSDFGAAIGRYANRINRGKFVLEGQEIQLPTNNIANPAHKENPEEPEFMHHLHGGPTGWQYQVYEVKEATDSTLVLVMNSPDGDNDFPGNVVATVTYTLTPNNTLDIQYEATTDKPTVINMTNHSYFNLTGDPTKPITDELLSLNSSNFTPVDDTYMTTGEIVTVEGTPFDFRTAKPIGQDIAADNEQIRNGNGYDHNWVLDNNGKFDEPAAVLRDEETGIMMTVYTDEPGIQVYTGNFLDGSAQGKKGINYNQRTGICLETQHYPDSPNKPEWPSTTLLPGDTYQSHTAYQFGTY